MRNIATALSATFTAIVIGLLIANVASAARAAEITQAKEQQLAALQDANSTSDLTSQLVAYRTRYAEAYQRLSAAYQALSARDAEYRAALDRANATSGQLAGANASLDTKLTEAYQALRDAQALMASLQGGLSGAPSTAPTTGSAPAVPAAPTASTPPTPRATAIPRPAATPRPSHHGGD